ncbi:MAG: leucine-rich repeat domain-containing protein, partial [Clostridia bacterium]|nr:leucine-rich repeat domain-containing protein [Clostridia bacterium]
VPDAYSFVAICYDYAFNNSTYEITLPKDVLSMYFNSESVSLSPNETLDLGNILNIFPSESWVQTLTFTSSDPTSVDVVNQTIIAKQNTGHDVVITASGKNTDGETVFTTLNVHVLQPGEEGYVGNYSIPEVSSFSLTGYKTLKAYYSTDSKEREIGETDSVNGFGTSKTLSMFPSASVKLDYVLDTYFPDNVTVSYKASNSRVSVTDDGIITANEKGSSIINVNILFDGKPTLFSARVNVTVKDPFTYSGIYLMNYRGNGGTVRIPGDHGVTMIYDYAFSGYKFVDKDLENGDVIDEEDPYYIKQMYIGDNTIKEIYLPEGVTSINTYAFANLTALETVHLPSTLTKIGVGAFIGCVNLKNINLENVQFINERAFSNCLSLKSATFENIVAIGNYSFEYCSLTDVEL